MISLKPKSNGSFVALLVIDFSLRRAACTIGAARAVLRHERPDFSTMRLQPTGRQTTCHQTSGRLHGG
jgi:hypothetical protein